MMTRKKLEALVWKHTHRDYRGVTQGVKHVLHLSPTTGATESWPLSSFSDADLVAKIPTRVIKELGMLTQAIRITYDHAHDECSAAQAEGKLPRDIENTWPNVLGFMRRIPGQPYHRAGINGVEDPPTEEEICTAIKTLHIHARRAIQARLW